MADYYGTLVGALAYHAARGNDAWAQAMTDALREAAMLRASEWLDATFRGRFCGVKTGLREQVREWPRTGVSDISGFAVSYTDVPVEIVNASYEAALRELASPGSLTPDFVASQQVISETVGPISTTYRSDVSQNDVRPVLHAVEDILSSLIGDGRREHLFGSAGRC